MPTLTKTEVMEIVAYCKENMFDTMTDSRSWASASGIFTSPRSAGKTGGHAAPVFPLNITPRVEERLSELGYTVADLQDAVARHKSSCDGEPSVYVGTYGKYNDGSLCGLWIDLSSFNSYDDFIEFCRAIHADEEDPELMAQDYEGFPRQWYNEGFMSEDDFDHILEYSDMCDKHDQEAVDDYMEFHDELDNFEEAYCGEWDSEEDFDRHIISECYNLESEMGDLARYFDYEAFGRELFMYDYSMGANNHVFRVI